MARDNSKKEDQDALTELSNSVKTIDSNVRDVLIRIRPNVYNDLIREQKSEIENETLCSSPDVRSEVPVRLGAS